MSPTLRKQAGGEPIPIIHDVDALRALCGEITQVHSRPRRSPKR